MAVMEGSPHRCTPGVDRFVPLGPLRRRDDIDCRDGSPFEREYECGPRLLVPGELHVYALDLPPGELSLHEEIQANEGKGQRDRLGLGVCVLRREGIDDVLVNERRIAMRQRVAAQFVVAMA